MNCRAGHSTLAMALLAWICASDIFRTSLINEPPASFLGLCREIHCGFLPQTNPKTTRRLIRAAFDDSNFQRELQSYHRKISQVVAKVHAEQEKAKLERNDEELELLSGISSEVEFLRTVIESKIDLYLNSIQSMRDTRTPSASTYEAKQFVLESHSMGLQKWKREVDLAWEAWKDRGVSE